MGTEPENDDDLRGIYGPGEEPAPEPAPVVDEVGEPVVEPAAEPSAAEPVATGEETQPVVVWDDQAAAQTIVVDEVARDEPVGPSRTQLLLAAALLVLFFVPWFDAGNFVESSGLGLVSWTSRFLNDLPSRDFDLDMLVPYLALLIPVGAMACIIRSRFGHRLRPLAIATGAVAPVLFLYALARSGGDLIRVLEPGAYLTLFCSLALMATGFVVLASRWGLVPLAIGSAVLIALAFLIPAATNDSIDSPLFAAYASDRTSLGPRTSDDLDDAEQAAPVTVPPDASEQTASTDVSAVTTTTVVGSTTTVVAAVTGTTVVVVGTTPPATARPCPSGGKTTTLERFHYDETGPGSNTYAVDVRGTIVNRANASMNVSSVEIDVMRGSTVVGHISVSIGGSLGPNDSVQWFRDNVIISSPDSPPSGGVITAVPATWSDPAFAGCATP